MSTKSCIDGIFYVNDDDDDDDDNNNNNNNRVRCSY
jgi:hypothetical protein